MSWGRWRRIRDELAEAEEGRLFLWAPVAFGAGVALYFSLPLEPSAPAAAGIAAAGLVLAALLRGPLGAGAVAMLVLLLASGFADAKLRTEWVRAPVVAGKGGVFTLAGRLLSITEGAEGRRDYVLGDLAIDRLPAERTPARIRLASRLKEEPPAIGARIRLRAVLRPPPGPVRPDGFDFARKSWFERIGAVGFAVSRAELVAPPQTLAWRERIETVRRRIAAAIRAVDSGPAGEVCVALVIGDQLGIDEATMKAIRLSGLAHMLSISGMHMVLVAGGLYWLLRALLALSETLALRYDIRRGAALAAILAALAYYLLSGMGIATLRSFLMIAIVFAAVLLGRSALNLRNVAVAALSILAVMPESLLDVSFQMSFAAVTALIAYYERFPLVRPFDPQRPLTLRLLAGAWRGLREIALTTTIAGLAVLPFGVYHFHQIATWSVLGNVLAMPVMTLFVMPMGLLGTLLIPLGLEHGPLALMAAGSALILRIADWVAALPFARVDVGLIGLGPVLLIVGGGLWLALWRSHLRRLGLLPLAVGLALAPFGAKPFLLVDRDITHVALVDSARRLWPSLDSRDSFSLTEWRKALGAAGAETARPDAPATASPWHCDEDGCTALVNGLRIAHSFSPAALEEDCRKAQVLVAAYPVSRNRPPCSEVAALIDLRDVRRHGAYAAYLEDGRVRLVSSSQQRGNRPWSTGR
jgi:competence protein ComEC